MQRLLALRALFFVFLLPGTVVVYIPYRLLRASGQLHPPAISVTSVAAGTLSLVGAGVLLSCVWQFFASGRGTLAPVDPPRNLVVTGLYRYTRNPMYNGVVLTLLGEAGCFHSLSILQYAGFAFVAAHLFVVGYEERTLLARFGTSFIRYRAAVPRWGFTLKPYTETGPSSV